MSSLTYHQVLGSRQNGSGDTGENSRSSVTSVVLTHKMISDVSCLSEFQNLERLDLSCNSLTSLEALRNCVNLKWLSVTKNKLESLQGIEELCKLTVLNAGKNKLKSMEQVRSLGNLRALILNDNDIVLVCQLETKELNTLVLSRNPIREIASSLKKMKSLTKVSLSHCQLESIGSAFKRCSELREARFSHNEIKSLPAELEHNKKLQNLDIGNNVITTWSDIKVLQSLTSLKNLNISGNPVADNLKCLKKMRTIVSKLRVFNSKPVESIKKSWNDTSIEAEEIIAKRRKKNPESGNDECTKNQIEHRTVEKAKKKLSEVEVLDDCEAPFADIVAVKSQEITEDTVREEEEAIIVAPKKRKSRKTDPIFQKPFTIGTWD